MWKSELNTLFQKLKRNRRDDNRYEVESFSQQLPHKLGCTKDGRPIFFVECCDSTKQVDIKLSLFTVMYNRSCDIYDNATKENFVKQYSVLQLNSDDEEFQKYFLDVVNMVLLRLPQTPETTVLDTEIKKIITLFTNAKRPSVSAIRGLFAELMVIDMAKDPKYLLRSWHVTPQDPFDFNDGVDKIEVKSCTKEQRKHTFSLEQLYPGENTRLVIASLAVLQTGFGMSVYDLMDRISYKVQDDINLLIHLRECVTATVGKYFDEVAEYQFDYGISEETFATYDSKDIPRIDKGTIPTGISNIRFTVDFADIKPIDLQTDTCNSKLFRALV